MNWIISFDFYKTRRIFDLDEPPSPSEKRLFRVVIYPTFECPGILASHQSHEPLWMGYKKIQDGYLTLWHEGSKFLRNVGACLPQHHVLEDRTVDAHRCENFKSRTRSLSVCSRRLPQHMSREEALQRLSLLGDLINPTPERKSTFSRNEIAEFQYVLTGHNHTVRNLMLLVGPAPAFTSAWT